MEDTTTGQIARYERPEPQGAGKLGRLGAAVRRSRSTGWPAEVSSGARGVFTSHRTLTGLRALGLNCGASGIRFEVRSRKGAGVWVMARGLGNAIAHGRMLSEATADLIKLLDPTVEVVRDTRGRRLA